MSEHRFKVGDIVEVDPTNSHSSMHWAEFLESNHYKNSDQLVVTYTSESGNWIGINYWAKGKDTIPFFYTKFKLADKKEECQKKEGRVNPISATHYSFVESLKEDLGLRSVEELKEVLEDYLESVNLVIAHPYSQKGTK